LLPILGIEDYFSLRNTDINANGPEQAKSVFDTEPDICCDRIELSDSPADKSFSRPYSETAS